MKKIMGFFTAVFAAMSFTVPAFAAASGSEGGGKTAGDIICVILLICAVAIYFKRKG